MQTPNTPTPEDRPLPRGISFQSTPEHGFYYASAERMKQMAETAPATLTPSRFYTGGNAFEEDCEWARLVLAFPDEWHPLDRETGLRIARHYMPDIYTAHTGQPLTPEDSPVLMERHHLATHAADWLGIAAYGDWREGVPPGYVLVTATIGAARRNHGAPAPAETNWLVKKERYDTRTPGLAFVIDPAVDILCTKDTEETLTTQEEKETA